MESIWTNFSNFTKMTKIRTMTMESMEWYGTVHMDSMDYSMDSIWNHSIWIPWTIPWIPYGMGLYQKFTKSNMESMFIPWTHSMDWIPWTPWTIPPSV
jgi:hypothetical protein